MSISPSLQIINEFEIIDRDDAERKQLESLIFQHYKKIYNAEIDIFLENIFKISLNENIISLAGMEIPGESHFFLEHYLSTSIESALSQKVGETVSRNKLVEIGSLVSFSKKGLFAMIHILTAWLYKNHFEWVVCTATKKLHANFSKLNLNIIELGQAIPSALDLSARDKWGTYYESMPMVIALNVADTRISLKKQFSLYYRYITELVQRQMSIA